MKLKTILIILLASVLILGLPLQGVLARGSENNKGRGKGKAGIVIHKTKIKRGVKWTQVLTATESPSPSPEESPSSSPEPSESPVPSPLPEESPSPSPSEEPSGRVKRGAQFWLTDFEQGLVLLITPSGNEHTLNLPQVAINNMMAAGVIQEGGPSPSPSPSPSETPSASPEASPSPSAEESPSPSPEESPSPSPEVSPSPSPSPEGLTTSEIEELVNELGQLLLSQQISERKYLLGIFPVEVITELIINTETGEVIEGQPSSLLDWILDHLTF